MARGPSVPDRGAAPSEKEKLAAAKMNTSSAWRRLAPTASLQVDGTDGESVDTEGKITGGSCRGEPCVRPVFIAGTKSANTKFASALAIDSRQRARDFGHDPTLHERP